MESSLARWRHAVKRTEARGSVLIWLFGKQGFDYLQFGNYRAYLFGYDEQQASDTPKQRPKPDEH